MYNWSTQKDNQEKKETIVESVGTTIICKEMKIHGDLTCDSNVILEGYIYGNVTCQDIEVKKDAVIEGNIQARNVNLYNNITGDICCSERLFTAETSFINGKVKANQVICEGQIKGNIETSDLLHIKKNSSVEGDCTYGRINIEDGAIINGRMLRK